VVRELSIGVIGCGTAGSAAAIFLARAGHKVTVYERVENPAPVGAGISLQPTGLHVLERLGLKREVVSRGARIDRLHCVTDEKRTLLDLHYRQVNDRYYGVGIHRGVVFQSLFNEVQESGANLRLGVAGVDLARAEHVVQSSGRPGPRRYWIVDSEGLRHGPHELVLVCDGARSSFRDDTDLAKVVSPYSWGAVWFVGEDREKRFSRTLYQVVRKNQKMLGLLPTGTGPSGITPLVSLYWSIRADKLEDFRNQGLEKWKDEILDFVPEAEDLVFQIKDRESVLYSGYHDVRMHRWNTRSVVYLGDAGHAMSPQLGQGCNLALWDAMILSDCLAADVDLPVALDAYSRTRREHLEFYQLATRWLTPFFQGDNEAFGTARDLAMPIMNKLGLTKRIMALSMCGVVDGFFGKTLPL
jgi:2-polyprenyl-6-methoxyphenol hydroxylase-like FAD-dependent oxidoreductase